MRKFISVLACFTLLLFSTGLKSQDTPLEVVVVGMSHDHVHGILQFHKAGKVKILAIVETDTALINRHSKNYALSSELFYNRLDKAIEKKRPAAVLAFNAINEHLAVVETCAPLKIPVMVEKPLATTVKDANRMMALSKQYQTPVLTNYETTWYGSNHYVKKEYEKGVLGVARKIVVHSGHEGPKEIGCSAEFLNWLTDPVKNGGGASRDFGCYGANLMTWFMKGKAPISVTAIIQQYKPQVYPKVDDVATIVLEYEDATGVIEASWNWPFSIKDLELYGSVSYLQAVNDNTVRTKKLQHLGEKFTVENSYFPDYITYLQAYLKNDPAIDKENDLSSLNNNLLVVKILEAATKSAKEGKKISLK